MRGEFVDVGGSRLYYYAAGTRKGGDPLVLIHGFATASHLWSNLVPLLPDGHRAVVVDLPGCGRSDPLGADHLSVSSLAGVIARFVASLSIERAILVGHGFGGQVALAFTSSHPHLVSRLCLVNTDLVNARLSRGARLAAVAAPFLPAFAGRPVLLLLERQMRSGYADAALGARSIEQYLRPFRSSHGFHQLMRHLRALRPARASLGTFDAALPVAIVCGEQDSLVSEDAGPRLHASIPSATLDYIPGARHYIPEENPEHLARIIRALVQR